MASGVWSHAEDVLMSVKHMNTLWVDVPTIYQSAAIHVWGFWDV